MYLSNHNYLRIYLRKYLAYLVVFLRKDGVEGEHLGGGDSNPAALGGGAGIREGHLLVAPVHLEAEGVLYLAGHLQHHLDLCNNQP